MLTRTVYLYDIDTKSPCGSYDAQESPLEPGVFLTPNNSTTVSPLPPISGYEVLFNGLTWVYKELPPPPPPLPATAPDTLASTK